ncbi:AGE family epimerase/isomerase [Komagataeibacter sp. NFXK3]
MGEQQPVGAQPFGALRDWMAQAALPLWIEAGFDPVRKLFHERLGFDAAPCNPPALRLMVQARQIATYVRAADDGHSSAGATALACMAQVRKEYWRADGAPGWVFSLGPDGALADTRRDLYAHAFILYACAWSYRLSGERTWLETARQTVDEITTLFGTPQPGGYLDTVPGQDGFRRQNPHMHLLEAFLALAEVGGGEMYLDHARALAVLGMRHFMLPGGAVGELFTPLWQPSAPPGQNRTEPGHVFEWAWLLAEYARLAGEGADSPFMHASARLHAFGMRHGVCPGTLAVCDAVTDHGAPLEATTRIWQQTEFIRQLARRAAGGDGGAQDLLAPACARFARAYVPPGLRGGWFDRLGSDGTPLDGYMPASSLYHIYGAVREIG